MLFTKGMMLTKVRSFAIEGSFTNNRFLYRSITEIKGVISIENQFFLTNEVERRSFNVLLLGGGQRHWNHVVISNIRSPFAFEWDLESGQGDGSSSQEMASQATPDDLPSLHTVLSSSSTNSSFLSVLDWRDVSYNTIE
jgi:hypothetical protein